MRILIFVTNSQYVEFQLSQYLQKLLNFNKTYIFILHRFKGIKINQLNNKAIQQNFLTIKERNVCGIGLRYRG